MWQKWKAPLKSFWTHVNYSHHPCLCVLFMMEMMCKWISAKPRQAIGFQTIALSLPISIFFKFFFFCLFLSFFLDWYVRHILTMGKDTLGCENLTKKEAENRLILALLDTEEVGKESKKGNEMRIKAGEMRRSCLVTVSGKSFRKLESTELKMRGKLVRSGLSEELLITRGETMTALMQEGLMRAAKACSCLYVDTCTCTKT